MNSNNQTTSKRSNRVPRSRKRSRAPQGGARFSNTVLSSRSLVITKYIDTNVIPANVGITPVTRAFDMPSQGIQPYQRIADTIFITRMQIRLSLSTANADVFNRVRLLLFTWKENTTYISPDGNAIFGNYSAEGVLTPLNYHRRNEYQVRYERLVKLVGTFTNPTTESLKDYVFEINFRGQRVDFGPGVVDGVGIPFMIYFSDSAVTPFPIISYVARMFYYDA